MAACFSIFQQILKYQAAVKRLLYPGQGERILSAQSQPRWAYAARSLCRCRAMGASCTAKPLLVSASVNSSLSIGSSSTRSTLGPGSIGYLATSSQPTKPGGQDCF